MAYAFVKDGSQVKRIKEELEKETGESVKIEPSGGLYKITCKVTQDDFLNAFKGKNLFWGYVLQD